MTGRNVCNRQNRVLYSNCNIMSDRSSITSIASNVVYIIFAAVIAVILYFVGVLLSIYSLEYMTLPSTSFTAIGYVGNSGISFFVLKLLDHVFRVLLLAVVFSIPASLVFSLFKQVSNDLLSKVLQIGSGLLFTFGILMNYTNKENYSAEEMPMIDTILLLVLFLLFLFYIFRSENMNNKRTAIFISGGATLAMIACLIIQVIALAVAVYAHVISSVLDKWMYVDMTAGSEWNILHILISLFSHFHNILFFGGVALVGLYFCYRVISFFVPKTMAARFLQSAISLWSLEFLLYAVTDEKSMKGAMFDTFDFSILIGMFALISVVALFGLFVSHND